MKTNKLLSILILSLLCAVFCLFTTACKDENTTNSNSSQQEHFHSYNRYGICSCGSTREIEVKVYIDGYHKESVYTDGKCDYKINAPEKPEDISTNPNSEKYFYGWFADSNYQTPLTDNTTFKQSSKIYGKWITVYSNLFKYTVAYGKATITGYIGGAPTVLVIPAYINSFPVEAVGVDAFKNQTTVRNVIVCDGIESLSGFDGCNSITNIVIPKTVKTLNSRCFANCGFESFEIPNSVTSIESAFAGCKRLTNVTIGNSVKSIGKSAFVACERLTNVTIGNSVKSIGKSAFSSCYGLTSITIPNSVTSIGESTFLNCTGLTSITIPNSMTSIGDFAFFSCERLTSVTIPNSVTSIGKSAFAACERLTNVTIGNGVTSINNATFDRCTGLTSITIPNSVKSIGDSAFSSCYGLTSVTIPNSVTKIGAYAFSGCTGLRTIYYKGTEKQWNTITKGSYWNYITGNYTIIYNA